MKIQTRSCRIKQDRPIEKKLSRSERQHQNLIRAEQALQVDWTVCLDLLLLSDWFFNRFCTASKGGFFKPDADLL